MVTSQVTVYWTRNACGVERKKTKEIAKQEARKLANEWYNTI